MCTRNGARYIREQLASIFAQTVPVSQLVVSDDASSDATLEIVRDVHALDGDRIELVVLENQLPLGVTANFEQALSRCTGDIILLSDQDDIWHSDRVAVTLAAFGEPGVLAVHGDARLVDVVGSDLGSTLLDSLEVPARVRSDLVRGDAVAAYLRRNLATGATMAISPRLRDQAIPFPDRWVHDEWLAMVAVMRGGLRLIPSALIDYRQHGANAIGVASPTLRRKIGRVLEPRGERNTLLSARAVQLLERLETLEIPGELREALQAKARHEQMRAGLPEVRIARVPQVLRAWARGGYSRFSSRGNWDVVRDLLQAA